MAQIFRPSTNTFSKVTIFGAVIFIGLLLWVLAVLYRSSWVTEVGVVREQPVPFSHQHHVGGLGIDCLYCHTSVEESSFAGLPPTQTCMNCHSQIWANSPMLAPVRESYRSNRSLAWTRVHDLADFAYFNHQIHVRKGIACADCHGEVDRMPLMWRVNSLQMRWCLDCHRKFENDPDIYPAVNRQLLSTVVQVRNNPQSGPTPVSHAELSVLTSCSTCHR
jgi:Zn ribbon nucleic-acid-binding protein